MQKKMYFYLVLFFLFAGKLTLAMDTQTLKERSESFLKLVSKGNIGVAYEQLLKDSDLPNIKPKGVEAVKKQTKTFLLQYGKDLGVENIDEKIYGSSLVKLTYIQKFKVMPIIWVFYYYRPFDSWKLVNFKFNDELKGF